MKYLVDYDELPNENLKLALENYIVHGLEPGGFMTAVLTNDLYSTVYRADAQNVSIIPHIVTWIHNNIPSICYGNSETMIMWMNDEGGVRSNYVKYLKQKKFWETIQK